MGGMSKSTRRSVQATGASDPRGPGYLFINMPRSSNFTLTASPDFTKVSLGSSGDRIEANVLGLSSAGLILEFPNGQIRSKNTDVSSRDRYWTAKGLAQGTFDYTGSTANIRGIPLDSLDSLR